MPSGAKHNLINTAAYVVITGAVLVAEQYQLIDISGTQMFNFSVAYFAGTFLLSPDLDLSLGRVDSKRNWGLLGFIWVPYAMLFKHRGLSHSWFVGPLTRLAYLALLIVIVAGLLRTFWPQLALPQLPSPLPYQLLLPCILGYYLSQWMHLIADGVPPHHGFIVMYKRKHSKSRKL